MRLIDQSLLKTALPLENRREGKVRDIYDLVLPDNSPGVLIVATDRVSVFDAVLGNGIPSTWGGAGGDGIVVKTWWRAMMKSSGDTTSPCITPLSGLEWSIFPFLSVPNVVIPMIASLALMNVLTTLIVLIIQEATTANVKLEELVTDSKQVWEL